MLSLITSNLPIILAFLAGGVFEYFVPKAIARIKALHPGQTLAQDLEAKIATIVDAKLAAKAAAPAANANTTTTA